TAAGCRTGAAPGCRRCSSLRGAATRPGRRPAGRRSARSARAGPPAAAGPRTETPGRCSPCSWSQLLRGWGDAAPSIPRPAHAYSENGRPNGGGPNGAEATVANRSRRVPEDVPGDFFVDTTCIDCDTCRQLAPAVFAEADDHACVCRQPETPADRRRALHALV